MIPEKKVTTHLLTYETPMVLLKSVNGEATIREGRLVNGVSHTTTSNYSRKKPDPIAVMKPGAFSRFRFGAQTLNVLCDTAIYNGKQLNASTPSASEYMAAVGKEVAIHYGCKKMPSEISQKMYQEPELWREDIITVILPEFKDE